MGKMETGVTPEKLEAMDQLALTDSQVYQLLNSSFNLEPVKWVLKVLSVYKDLMETPVSTVFQESTVRPAFSENPVCAEKLGSEEGQEPRVNGDLREPQDSQADLTQVKTAPREAPEI